MNSNDGKKFVELLKKREKLEGTRIFRTLHHLATSQYAVNKNYHAFSKAIKFYENNLSIWEVTKRPQLNAFLREFLRLLHNYLASVYSLIEHTRIFCKELNNAELNSEYAVKLKELQNHICVRFVRDLRTYSQHIQLPIISAKLSFTKTEHSDGGETRQQILLSSDELLKWKQWHKDSKKYLGSLKEIDLKVVLNKYQILIEAFYKWLYEKVEELYREHLEELAKIESELAKFS
jgi:hypothetical protein